MFRTFGQPCEAVHTALSKNHQLKKVILILLNLSILGNQIESWKTAETCGTGQKCLYKVIINYLRESHKFLYLTVPLSSFRNCFLILQP